MVGKRDARAGHARAAGRRARAAGRLPRAGQDADRPVVRPGHLAGVRPGAVHARPDAVGRDRLLDLQPALGRLRVPARAVFTNLLLGDEINRSPPKTQAALLEAMQERQVTIDGVTRSLERPFLVVATQNLIEFEGTYPLPEAQLDRFLPRLSIGYPSPEAEWRMLERRLERTADEVELARVATPADVLAMQRAVEQVHVAPASAATSSSWSARPGPAPESRSAPAPGQPGPAQGGQAKAALAGRDFVTPRTSRRRPSPPWPASSSGPSCRCAGSAPRTWSPSCWSRSRPRPAGRAGPRPDPPGPVTRQPQRQDRRLRRGGRPGAAGRPRPGPARAGGGDRPAGRAGGGRPGRRPRPGRRGHRGPGTGPGRGRP